MNADRGSPETVPLAAVRETLNVVPAIDLDWNVGKTPLKRLGRQRQAGPSTHRR